MSRSTFLVTVSGPDRHGVGAELFGALRDLEDEDVHLMDVAQITIRGTLVLCAEVSAESALTHDVLMAALAKRPMGRRELRHLTDWNDGRPGTELNFKFYRQSTNKIIGISDRTAAFLSKCF